MTVNVFAIPLHLEAQTTTKISVATGGAPGQGDVVGYKPAVSADGRVVAFASYAANLVAGDTNGTIDVFVHDRQSGVTTRVSVASDGTQGNDISEAPALSADGRPRSDAPSLDELGKLARKQGTGPHRPADGRNVWDGGVDLVDVDELP